MTANDDYILEILQSVGLVDSEQAAQAREAAQKEDLPVAEILARNGVVSKLDVLKTLAN